MQRRIMQNFTLNAQKSLVLICTLLCCIPLQVCLGKENQKKDCNLQQMYEYHCKRNSDINKHLPILRQIASECSSVAEIGVRSIVSTWGVLQGLTESPYQKRSYLGIDLAYPPAKRLKLAKQLAQENNIDFTFWRVNDLYIELEPVDMLFIDSLHTYYHLTYELEKFSSSVRKYICMHDTEAPWGFKDEKYYSGNYSEYPQQYDKNKKGLWLAVEDFLQKHPEWILFEHRTSNHGFTILKRTNEKDFTDFTYNPTIDYFLKNKIILCTGPAFERYNILKETTESDMNLIPFKKIFVSTNEPKVMDITFNGKKPICEFIENREKQIDCVNCIISALKNAVNDSEVKNDDIILFKHESVFINDMKLIKKAINKLLDGYDLVVRSKRGLGFGTDAFFVKVSAIKKLINTLPLITKLTKSTYNCESYFTKKIASQIPVGQVYNIPYAHSNRGVTELGFYHLSFKKDYYKNWSTKKQYEELFKAK